MDISKLTYRPCVGLMVVNAQGQIWVGRRVPATDKKEPGGWWQMPQGGIDEGETPAAAALRELHEETGIRSARILGESRDWHHYDLPAHLMGKLWGGKHRGQKQKWFAIRFDGPDSEINIAPEEHDQEFDSWRWASLDEVMDLIVPFKRQVYAAVIAEFRPLVTASK